MESLDEQNLADWRRIARKSTGGIPGKASSRRRLTDLLPVKSDSIRRLVAAPQEASRGDPREFGIGAGNFTGWPPGILHCEGEFTRGVPMESQDRRRLAARFPGVLPARSLPASPLGNLGKFTGKLAHRDGEIAGFELSPCAAEQVLRPK